MGLRYGASMSDVKRARRALARQWHPDLYPNPDEHEIAERRIKKINAAYETITRVKQRRAGSTNTDTGSRSTRKSSAKSRRSRRSSAYSKQRSQSKQQQKQRQKSYSSNQNSYRAGSQQRESTATGSAGSATHSFQHSRLDRWLSRISNWTAKKQLNFRREKRIRKMQKRIEQERKLWINRYEEYKKSSRIGLYKSLFNALLFGRIERMISSKEHGRSLQGFSMQDKYELDLHFSIIQDRIFYAMNKGVNLFLKYALGIMFAIQFIYNIYTNFFQGRFYGNTSEFMWAQLLVTLLFAILLLPDNLYQRFLLWKFRNVPFERAKELFDGERLPGKYDRIKSYLLAGKYAVLGLALMII